jgi:hypothetical protein
MIKHGPPGNGEAGRSLYTKETLRPAHSQCRHPASPMRCAGDSIDVISGKAMHGQGKANNHTRPPGAGA